MKTQLSTLAVAACLTAGLFTSAVDARGRGADAEAKKQKITEALGLDEAQAAELQTIMELSREARHAIMEQGRESGDREAARADMEALRADTDRQLQDVLTPEQFTRLQEMRPERGEGPRGGQGNRSGRRSGPR